MGTRNVVSGDRVVNSEQDVEITSTPPPHKHFFPLHNMNHTHADTQDRIW